MWKYQFAWRPEEPDLEFQDIAGAGNPTHSLLQEESVLLTAEFSQIPQTPAVLNVLNYWTVTNND